MPALRFAPADNAFPERGLLNLTSTAAARYGQPCPILGSRPAMRGSDDPRAARHTCLNCDQVPALARDSEVDVEPRTGAALYGALRVQMNLHVGQLLWGNGTKVSGRGRGGARGGGRQPTLDSACGSPP